MFFNVMIITCTSLEPHSTCVSIPGADTGFRRGGGVRVTGTSDILSSTFYTRWNNLNNSGG